MQATTTYTTRTHPASHKHTARFSQPHAGRTRSKSTRLARRIRKQAQSSQRLVKNKKKAFKSFYYLSITPEARLFLPTQPPHLTKPRDDCAIVKGPKKKNERREKRKNSPQAYRKRIGQAHANTQTIKHTTTHTQTIKHRTRQTDRRTDRQTD